VGYCITTYNLEVLLKLQQLPIGKQVVGAKLGTAEGEKQSISHLGVRIDAAISYEPEGIKADITAGIMYVEM
jgi:hypothetical protein